MDVRSNLRKCADYTPPGSVTEACQRTKISAKIGAMNGNRWERGP